MIVIGGDALIDLIDRGNRMYEACPGGSTLNCALAAGQLGAEVLYVSTLSNDAYGNLLADRLKECHVNLRANARSEAYSSLAVVSLDDSGQPSYAFYREGMADREIPVDEIIASFPDNMSVLHVGSLALIPPEDQDAWILVVQAAKSRGAIISIDPNCRPSMTKQADIYRKGMVQFLEAADLIKLSDEDLEYLHPEWEKNAFDQFVQTYQPSLCVYTRGSQGLLAVTATGVSASSPAHLPGTLSDTVGAGDTIQGTLLAEIDRQNLTTETIGTLSEEALNSVLVLASQAAGINCTRSGCQPPTRAEITEIYSQGTSG